jgi:membrane protein YdbS with pleckstrin-like domain
MPEYRITIGSTTNGSHLPGRRPRKVEVLKAAIVGLLGLAIVIGILLAAFVLGSVIASLLLVLLAVVFIIAVVRYQLRKLKSRLKIKEK